MPASPGMLGPHSPLSPRGTPRATPLLSSRAERGTSAVEGSHVAVQGSVRSLVARKLISLGMTNGSDALIRLVTAEVSPRLPLSRLRGRGPGAGGLQAPSAWDEPLSVARMLVVR